jgi:DnaA-homolog protein
MHYHQQTLPFAPIQQAEMNRFVTGPNLQVISQLQNLLDEPAQETILLIQGTPSSGKTFLLHAACQLAEKKQFRCAYFPLRDMHKILKAELFQDLETLDLVAIDDIESIAQISELEQAIFNLFNEFKARNKRLIFTTRTAIPQLSFQLPDLQSRLKATLSLELKPLSDQDKIKVLTHYTDSNGLRINKETLEYLIRRYSREMHDLLSVIRQLDHYSLREKQKITIPFIKKWIRLS